MFLQFRGTHDVFSRSPEPSVRLESGLGRFDAQIVHGKTAVLDEFLIFISWHPKQPFRHKREVYIGFLWVVHEKNPAKNEGFCALTANDNFQLSGSGSVILGTKFESHLPKQPKVMIVVGIFVIWNPQVIQLLRGFCFN